MKHQQNNSPRPTKTRSKTNMRPLAQTKSQVKGLENTNKLEEHIDADDDDDDDDETPATDVSIEYACTQCIRIFATKAGLSTHTREMHNPEYEARRLAKKPFQCSDCSKRYRTEELMLQHKSTHAGFYCDVCGHRFTQKGSLVLHSRRHLGVKNFKCDYGDCTYSGFTKRELQSHVMCHTGIMPRVCEICGKQCRDSGKLKEHMLRHTGER